jgi:probable HAF family extracellular repeat protein
MFSFNCLMRRRQRLTGGPRSGAAFLKYRPRFEGLETRQLPSTIIDLGILAAGGSSFAAGINDQGEAVGGASASSGYYPNNAFLWNTQDGIQDLGTFEDGGTSSATGINDRDQVVGAAAANSEGHPNHAFLWDRRHGMQDLGTLGGQYSDATGINNRGQVVGYSSIDPTYPRDHAFLWDRRHGMQDLGTLGGDTSGADAINDRGQVVGSTGGHVFLWDHRHGMQDLGFDASPTALNNVGQIVGNRGTFPFQRAFLWDAQHGVQDLGALDGFGSFASGINDAGQVVGYSSFNGINSYHAFLYRDGVMTDLNDLLPPGSNWRLIEARAINDAGQIVGFGDPDHSGQNHAFLLTLDQRDRPGVAASLSSAGLERIAVAGPFGEDPGASTASPGGNMAGVAQDQRVPPGQEPVAEVGLTVSPEPRQWHGEKLLAQQVSQTALASWSDFGDADTDVDLLFSRS